MERDLRDPQAIGEEIIRLRGFHPKSTASERADYYFAERVEIPTYDRDETVGTIQAKRYRQELRERAANGDKYAISLLNGGKPPGADEPE